MIRILRRGARRLVDRFVFHALDRADERRLNIGKRIAPLNPMDKKAQIALTLQYRELLRSKALMPTFADVGFQAFSQTDEDGILLYLFALLGSTNRRCVEICVGNGIECNTANLIINHGWQGLLFDGDAASVEAGRAFYHANPCTWIVPPRFDQAWITRDNINGLVAEGGFSGEIDLLSLDIDGVDYWIWQALDVISPRVVVAEFQAGLGPDQALTVPYRDDFHQADLSTGYFGASLTAFVKLGREKGYRLVGVNRYGFNAFFVRDDLGQEWLPEVTPAQIYAGPYRSEQRDFPLLNTSLGPWEAV